jgi:rhamnogalacturonyl hydrolase YesR
MKQETIQIEQQVVNDLIDEIKEIKETLIDETDYDRRHYLKGVLFENIDRILEQTGDGLLIDRVMR